ncbi:MAG: hypothetical protein ACI8X5_000528 [Planctomycetota bacterium]|jgi:hypothetical protein
MMKSLLFPALFLFGGAGTVPVAEPLSLVVVDDDAVALTAECNAAVAKWSKAMEAATKDERKELRKANPAIAFLPRFKALSDAGNGRALLWMAMHVRETGVKMGERGDVLRTHYNKLVAEHKDAEWFGTALESISKNHRSIGDESALALFAATVETSKTAENRAGALYFAGTMLKKSEDEKSKARGITFLARVEAEFASTTWGKKLAASHVFVGDMAPDFEGSTHDDFDFNLSDYRGKVVLLDFYGFW